MKWTTKTSFLYVKGVMITSTSISDPLLLLSDVRDAHHVP